MGGKVKGIQKYKSPVIKVQHRNPANNIVITIYFVR